MTAGDRLRQLAGQAGAAGALLLLIGSGANAGAALVDSSCLASGTAAAHLLDDRACKGGGAYLPLAGWPQSLHDAWLQAHRKAQEDAARLAAMQPIPETDGFVVGPQESIYTPPDLYIPTPAEIEAMFRRNLEAMRAAAPKLAEQIEAEATAEEEAVIHLMNWMME